MLCANSLTLLKIQDKLVRKGKTTPTGEWTAPLGLLNFRNRTDIFLPRDSLNRVSQLSSHNLVSRSLSGRKL